MKYVTVRMTSAQAMAASNACDLIAESLRADRSTSREAGLYDRACSALSAAIQKEKTR